MAGERKLRGLDEEEEKKKKEAEKKEGEEGAGGESKDKSQAKEGEEEAPAAKKEEEWKPFIPEVPSKICWAFYSSAETFWLSMDDYDAGYLYECKFMDEAQKARTAADKIDEPFKSVAVIGSDLIASEDIPLTCMVFK